MIWLMFVLGQFLHLALQVDTIARARNNPASSRLQILLDRWTAFAGRLFLCSMLFWVFLAGGLPEVLSAVSIESPQWLMTLAVLIQSQGGAALAGIIGWGIDSALAYLPVLKSSVPAAPDATAPPSNRLSSN